ncbi:hypothetical protein KBC54_02215 [Patescibacteria group bacterium]|nr:hypothetical protein [Patescibacteria group bacterium]
MKKIVVSHSQYPDGKWYLKAVVFEGTKITNIDDDYSCVEEKDALKRIDNIAKEYHDDGFIVEIKSI